MGAWDDDHRFMKKVTAEADLSGKRFHAVKKGTAADGVVLCGNTQEAWGILQDKPESGAKGDIVRSGVSKAVAGGTFDPGVRLMSNGSGRLVTATGSGAFVVARAESAGLGDGKLCTVYVLPAPYALP